MSSSLAASVGPGQTCPTQSAALTNVGVSATYDALGDMTSKIGNGGVGNYSYPAAGQPRPHAVQSITSNPADSNDNILGANFSYDADGNATVRGGFLSVVAYNAFGMPQMVCSTGVRCPNSNATNMVTFTYGPDHERVSQLQTGPGAVDTIYYPDFDVSNAANGAYPATVHFYFKDNDDHIVGQINRVFPNGPMLPPVVNFFLNDWQNSVSTIADVNGNQLETDSYDAWGKRRNLNGSPDVNNVITSQTIHGYTNQEHLQNVGLIDLNARLYDPYIGNMLSVDPAVANWADPQTWNAYAYARDNPMVYTDPTGETVSEGGDTAAECVAELATAVYAGVAPPWEVETGIRVVVQMETP